VQMLEQVLVQVQVQVRVQRQLVQVRVQREPWLQRGWLHRLRRGLGHRPVPGLERCRS
jgi:hypothetical protein